VPNDGFDLHKRWFAQLPTAWAGLEILAVLLSLEQWGFVA
jgi:hypothetical protein